MPCNGTQRVLVWSIWTLIWISNLVYSQYSDELSYTNHFVYSRWTKLSHMVLFRFWIEALLINQRLFVINHRLIILDNPNKVGKHGGDFKNMYVFLASRKSPLESLQTNFIAWFYVNILRSSIIQTQFVFNSGRLTNENHMNACFLL